MDVLRGVIERITYHNEETGYTVAKLTPEFRAQSDYGQGSFGRNREVAIIGTLVGVNVGESVELTGRWTIHAEYGRQFVVEGMRTVLPATVAGIEKYLGSGLIRGVGPVTAKRIVKHFGVETLAVIEEQAHRLNEVPGVGQKRVQMIMTAWQEQKAIKEVMLFLQSHGVSTSLATKIYKFYGDDAIGIVRQDPYRLARDIFGIGFLTADRIAQSMGLAPDSPQRVAAGVAYALNQATEEGHVFLPTSELVKQAGELLGVSRDEIGIGVVRLWHDDQVKVAVQPGDVELAPLVNIPLDDEIPKLIAEGGQLYAVATSTQAQQILDEERAIYLTPFYYSEQGVANQLQRLMRLGESSFARFQQRQDWEKLLSAAEVTTGLRLAPQQRSAIQAALTHRVTVLTGGPGTGKTTSIRILLQICDQHRYRVVLAAPTGRAAKRLAETTGREAKTLHRLLEFKPAEGMSFHRNADNPLEGDLLIVDEASMLDLLLTNHLLKAIPPGMHLLLVGDVDQLPSVGAGNVLKDIIAAIEEINSRHESRASSSSHLVTLSPGHPATVIRLQTIFRQAAGSFIITNAHRINQGEMPTVDNETATDFFLFRTDEPERAAQLCVELVQSRIPKRFAIPSRDIQVLSPMHRGIIGVGALNEALQNGLNPAAPQKPEKRVGNRIYRIGDRVMQIRNNYDKDVYNGDMGAIQALDMEMQKVTVNIDGRAVVYDFLELDELVHAYAVSVHKSQGSEFPAVVIPVLTSHYMMLQRNLLYTAVTRAKRLVVLVGQPKAIAMAVRNDKVTQRFTGLRERLTSRLESSIIGM
ncbi:MAG: ATP-dependent RecD-like DNA helicase [Caldilinea sp. CFX5]|nr:ATP-dependent RecD-like DNA helicase [Caldilinea sp. CFX5]